MMNSIQRFLIATVGITIATIGAPTVAQAFNFTFAQSFDSNSFDGDISLTGSFSGHDDDDDGVLEADEFTSFQSVFTSDEPGFERVTWGLKDLVEVSRFSNPDNFAFVVANSGINRGWLSFNLFGDIGQTVVGFAPSRESIGGLFFAESLDFTKVDAEAIPEPTTMAGLALAGLGLSYLRRRRQP